MLNINQLNSKTCDKTHVNKNSNNNNEEREPLDQYDKKSESEEITEQSNAKTLHKKTLHNYGCRFNSKTFAWIILANKTSSDNITLVKPFPGARAKAMKYHVNPDLEKKSEQVILHNATNDLSVHLKSLPVLLFY